MRLSMPIIMHLQHEDLLGLRGVLALQAGHAVAQLPNEILLALPEPALRLPVLLLRSYDQMAVSAGGGGGGGGGIWQPQATQSENSSAERPPHARRGAAAVKMGSKLCKAGDDWNGAAGIWQEQTQNAGPSIIRLASSPGHEVACFIQDLKRKQSVRHRQKPPRRTWRCRWLRAAPRLPAGPFRGVSRICSFMIYSREDTLEHLGVPLAEGGATTARRSASSVMPLSAGASADLRWKGIKRTIGPCSMSEWPNRL